MPAEGRVTPQLIEAIQALLNAIGKEDEKWTEIEKAKTVLAELGGPGSGSRQQPGATAGATIDTGDIPRRDIDKEPGEGSGNVKVGIPGDGRT
jgi:hypothetical protein